ncbi:hypothetical protein Lal_00027244 [Lupinus albus]|nr:hypothetical protein Lal_00027244 [Lupinus albus]
MDVASFPLDSSCYLSVKVVQNRPPCQPKRVRDGGSSSQQNPTSGLDPFYAENLEGGRLTKFMSRKPTYLRYTDMAWLAEQECRLLHYLIAYILVQCNTNHGRPTINDLKLMFAIRVGILVLVGTAKSLSRLLAYGIFTSHVIDHVDICASDVENFVNYREHLVGDNLIHKISIYKHGDEWMYQKDHCKDPNSTLEIFSFITTLYTRFTVLHLSYISFNLLNQPFL